MTTELTHARPDISTSGNIADLANDTTDHNFVRLSAAVESLCAAVKAPTLRRDQARIEADAAVERLRADFSVLKAQPAALGAMDELLTNVRGRAGGRVAG
jgi:hypothetical protein